MFCTFSKCGPTRLSRKERYGKLILDFTANLLNQQLSGNLLWYQTAHSQALLVYMTGGEPDACPTCPQSRKHSLCGKAAQSNCLKAPLHLA